LRYPRVASFDLLARTPPKAVYTTRDGLASDEILRVFEDTRGDIWIAEVNGVNGHGLSRWERSTETFHHYTEADGLPSPKKVYPISFAEDRTGAIWVGFSVGGGLVLGLLIVAAGSSSRVWRGEQGRYRVLSILFGLLLIIMTTLVLLRVIEFVSD